MNYLKLFENYNKKEIQWIEALDLLGYEINDVLGFGEMGIVYSLENRNDIVVKITTSQIEANTALYVKKLNHKNIVDIKNVYRLKSDEYLISDSRTNWIPLNLEKYKLYVIEIENLEEVGNWDNEKIENANNFLKKNNINNEDFHQEQVMYKNGEPVIIDIYDSTLPQKEIETKKLVDIYEGKIPTSFRTFLSELHDGGISEAHKFYVPPIKDERTYWFFNQFISMVLEIRENNISSKDYFNSDNLGFKENGNLGVFDLGFGDYWEEFEQDVENIQIKENLFNTIKKSMGVSGSKLIGKGMFGVAHDVGNNKILKITKDKSEAVNANRVKNKKNKHIANVFNVKSITKNKKEYYAILIEKLKLDDEITKEFNKLIDIFGRTNS